MKFWDILGYMYVPSSLLSSSLTIFFPTYLSPLPPSLIELPNCPRNSTGFLPNSQGPEGSLGGCPGKELNDLSDFIFHYCVLFFLRMKFPRSLATCESSQPSWRGLESRWARTSSWQRERPRNDGLVDGIKEYSARDFFCKISWWLFVEKSIRVHRSKGDPLRSLQ